MWQAFLTALLEFIRRHKSELVVAVSTWYGVRAYAKAKVLDDVAEWNEIKRRSDDPVELERMRKQLGK